MDLRIINHVDHTENIEFKDWLWEKFNQWRGKTTNGPTAFARYLDVKQQYVSGWLSGKYKPKSLEHITKIAAKYPDVYDILGVPSSPDPLPLDKLPVDFRERLSAALREVANTLERTGVDPESDEAERVTIEVMERHGFKYTDTANG